MEIASTLIQFMHRHHLTRSCFDDLCQLLMTLKVPNVPKSFASTKRLLESEDAVLKSKQYFICTECDRITNASSGCKNLSCSQHQYFRKKPISYIVLSISDQLRSIIKNCNYSFTKKDKNSDIIRDIVDGNHYYEIEQREKNQFFTLTMNVDGVQISASSNKSLWIFTFVINEIVRSQRFKLQNLIVGAVSDVNSKPKRAQLQTMLQVLVHQLKKLEQGILVEFSPEVETLVRVFLIASCCDKPAQALVQNAAEPTGVYGCGRCTIKGKPTLHILIR